MRNNQGNFEKRSLYWLHHHHSRILSILCDMSVPGLIVFNHYLRVSIGLFILVTVVLVRFFLLKKKCHVTMELFMPWDQWNCFGVDELQHVTLQSIRIQQAITCTTIIYNSQCLHSSLNHVNCFEFLFLSNSLILTKQNMTHHPMPPHYPMHSTFNFDPDEIFWFCFH